MTTIVIYVLVMFNIARTEVVTLSGELPGENECLLAMAAKVKELNLYSRVNQLACVRVERKVRMS